MSCPSRVPDCAASVEPDLLASSSPPSRLSQATLRWNRKKQARLICPSFLQPSLAAASVPLAPPTTRARTLSTQPHPLLRRPLMLQLRALLSPPPQWCTSSEGHRTRQLGRSPRHPTRSSPTSTPSTGTFPTLPHLQRPTRPLRPTSSSLPPSSPYATTFIPPRPRRPSQPLPPLPPRPTRFRRSRRPPRRRL